MWIRWQKFTDRNGKIILRAQFARSFRDIKTRKPRTQILLHLGSIPENDCSNIHARLAFWLRCEQSLNSSSLTDEQKAICRRLISKRIGKARISLPIHP
jgi:hypothetical protein